MFPFKLRTYKDTAYKHCHGNSNQGNATRKVSKRYEYQKGRNKQTFLEYNMR